MGCFMSSKMDHLLNSEPTTKSRPRKVVQSARGDYGDIRGGITAEPKSKLTSLKPNDTWTLGRLNQAPVIDPNAPLPGYDDLFWDQRILTAVEELQDILPEFGIELGSLLRTQVTFVVDDNHRYNDKQVFAISILMGVFIPLLNSLNASAWFGFMTHQNPERDSYDQKEQDAANFLDSLYVMDSPAKIKSAVNASNLTLLETRKTGGGEKGILREEIDKIWADPDIRPDERLGPIISLVRDVRYDFTEPYKASEYGVQEFKELFTEARASDEQQPNVLSNLTFYMIRMVQRQRAAWNVRQKDTSGRTTRRKTILITAEGIDKTPFKTIAKELNKVEGGGAENSIQHIEFVNHTQKGLSRGQKLDDMKGGDADIYDYSRIDIDTFLDSFLSGYGLAKLLFSEEASVDSFRFTMKKPFYGRHICERTQAGAIVLPAKEHYQTVFQGYGAQRSGSSGHRVIPSGGNE